MAEQKIDFTLPTIPGMPGQTPVSIPTKEVEKPTINRFTSAIATEASNRGKDIKNMDYWAGVQERANKPINPLQAALMGALKALPTLMATSKYNNPLVSGIAGLSSGVQNVGDMQQAQKEQAFAELENSDFEARFPDFIEANPEFKGSHMTVGEAKKILPVFSAFKDKQKAVDIVEPQDYEYLTQIMINSGKTREQADTSFRSFLDQPMKDVLSLLGKNISPMLDVEPTIKTLANGLQVIETKSKFGTKYSFVPGQILSESDKSRISLTKEALREADVVEGVLKSPEAQKILIKAGGDLGKLASFGDETSQRVYRAVRKMADARTRILTGAQVNAQEMDMYFNDFFSRLYSVPTMLSNIQQEKRFYNDFLDTISLGKRLGSDIPKNAPAVSPPGVPQSSGVVSPSKSNNAPTEISAW